MQIYEYRNHIGQLQSFEIENALIGRRGVVRVLSKIPEVKIVQPPKLLLSWFREEEFCKFEIGGTQFLVEEPFGDNSRYWIGGPRQNDQLEIVAKAFKAQRWPLGL